jgi:hypothetical protein
MLEEYDLGVRIAIGGAKAAAVQWTPHDFVQELQNRFDWNKFDYQDGEAEMLLAVLAAYQGFLSTNETLDWQTEIEAVQKDRRAWEADEKVMAQIKREWEEYRLADDDPFPYEGINEESGFSLWWDD